MGTGIGGGLILDGRLYRGANGNAGEIGHMRVVDHGGPLCGCGKHGCLEAYCSGPSIARRTRTALSEQPDSRLALTLRQALDGDLAQVTAEHLFEAARDGDALALHLVDETAHYLGIGLANVIQAFNPEVIVLGTIATAQGDFLLDRVRSVVRAETWPLMNEVVEIVPSPLGSRVGDYAAISVLLQEIRNPCAD
jgi:glucokinase